MLSLTEIRHPLSPLCWTLAGFQHSGVCCILGTFGFYAIPGHLWVLCHTALQQYMGPAVSQCSSVGFNSVIYASVICQDLLVRTAEYVPMSGCSF